MASVTECRNKGKEEACSDENDSSSEISIHPWPFIIKLTPDLMQPADSFQFSPSVDFEDGLLALMKESIRKDLDLWIPVKILIYDVEMCETYEATLCKKEALGFQSERVPRKESKTYKWFSGFPSCFMQIDTESLRYDLKKASREEEFYYYVIQPFNYIIEKRGLKHGQKIGFRFSRKFQCLEFSVHLHQYSSD